VSISSTFYEQLLCQYSWGKRKAAKNTFVQKGECKMLMKLTTAQPLPIK